MRQSVFAPYIYMKNLYVFIFLFFCGFAIFAENSQGADINGETLESVPAETPVSNDSSGKIPESAPSEAILIKNPIIKKPFFDWNLLFTGSWEESSSVDFQGNLSNRLELKLTVLPVNLLIRGQILDRRVLNFAAGSFKLDNFFPMPEKDITNYTGGLYHKTTGSRLLFGVLDESGLPARIRNPWIRSPPYAETRGSISADLKTAASGTREDEAYLYLKSPLFEISPDIKLRGFLSAQTELHRFTPAASGGVDFYFGDNNLKLDLFYTARTLPPSNVSAWFSYPPPLPERDFRLFAAGVVFSHNSFSVSSDFAFSETFAWGKDIYLNLGANITPLLPFGSRVRPLLVSFAFDGAGERFVFRDGSGYREGFRSAMKIEWRSRYNALYKIDFEFRGPSFGENFNRGSLNLYLRFPFSARNREDIIRISTITFSADRNAANNLKITDSFSASVRLRLSFSRFGIQSPFSLNFSGSVIGKTTSESLSIFPVTDEWILNSSSFSFELSWPPSIFQLSTKAKYTMNAEKDDIWEFSASASAHFKYGRITIKAESPNLPDKWNLSFSWRTEIP